MRSAGESNVISRSRRFLTILLPFMEEQEYKEERNTVISRLGKIIQAFMRRVYLVFGEEDCVECSNKGNISECVSTCHFPMFTLPKVSFECKWKMKCRRCGNVKIADLQDRLCWQCLSLLRMRIISAVVRNGYISPSATRQSISSMRSMLNKEEVDVSLRQLWDWKMVGKILEAYVSGRIRQVGKQLAGFERRFRSDVFVPALNHYIRSPLECEEDSALHFCNAMCSFVEQQGIKRYGRVRPIIFQRAEPLITKIRSQPLNHLEPQYYRGYPLITEEFEDSLGLEEYFKGALEVFRDSIDLLINLRKQAIIFKDLSEMLRVLSDMGIYTWSEAHMALTFEMFPTDKEE